MLATTRPLERADRSFLDCLDDCGLNAGIAEAHGRLAAHMAEMNTSGMLLDPTALRLLRTYVNQALGVAIAYRRKVGPCGYGCRFPGLHCPAEDPLETLFSTLEAGGWSVPVDDPRGLATANITCVCGNPMGLAALVRGRQHRAWAICGSCRHWVAL
jgi:hypothetical protein